jgi:hypothetical protein
MAVKTRIPARLQYPNTTTGYHQPQFCREVVPDVRLFLFHRIGQETRRYARLYVCLLIGQEPRRKARQYCVDAD